MLLPVFVTSVAAHGFTVFYQRRSILTERISRRGHHLSREYSVDPLEVTLAQQVMHTRIVVLPDELSAADAAQWLETGRTHTDPKRGQRLYPLVDQEGRLTGVMTRHDLAALAESKESGQRPAPPTTPVVAYSLETLRTVAERMATRQLFVLPVVEPGTDKLVGLINTMDILQARARAHERETKLERLRMPYGRRIRKEEPAPLEESA